MKPQDYQVLVFAPSGSGHHPNFARLIAEAFQQIDVNVHVAATSRVSRMLEGNLADREKRPVKITPILDRAALSPLARLRGQLGDLHELMLMQRWNRVIIPAGDGLLQILGLTSAAGIRIVPAGVRVEALMLRGGIAYPGSGRQHLKHRASWRLAELAPVAVRHHLDPIVIEWLEHRETGRAHWQLMPDPIDVRPPQDKEVAREVLQLPPSGIIIGCVGELNRRKGIHLLLEAFQDAGLPSHVHLLLAGGCEPEIGIQAATLASSSRYKGRVHLRNRWLTDSELETSLSAMDLVTVPYPRHIGSASIALRAMAAQRPILGSRAQWIDRHVRKYKAGWVCDVEDSEAFRTALADTLGNLVSWKPSPLADELLRFNSSENFKRHWVRKTVEDIGGHEPDDRGNSSPPGERSTGRQ